ncbi:hypothetical protein SNE40_017484 [Patella caerulea]
MGPDFEEFITYFDIVCLTETKLGNTDEIRIDNFTLFVKNRKRSKINSGGVAVLVKNKYISFINVHDTDDNFSLCFTMNEKKLGFKLICRVAYIPPENTRYSKIEMFDILETRYLELYQKDVEFCLTGDFNARTASSQDIDN